ncbi:sushi, von Willebrand factor type A, EGF and pentraxin domain-containing protein 1-like [Macrobrachium nipponense]|uniref:sushi, von Willebrand factor type A, EGF and pentraxin domain-containing protein 1-like n=1 Tax=Macrobrachium nipponense TaxID=159736 RepID=UPI0030C7C4AB
MPQDDILALAGERIPSKPFRYATLPATLRGDVNLTAVGNVVGSAPQISYAACQLYGPRGCWTNPPVLAETTYQEWNGQLETDTVVTHKCFPGYFMNNSISKTEQKVTCWGQLGGWVAPEDEIYNCTILEVCGYNRFTCNGSLHSDILVSEDFLTLNSSIQFTCPPRKAMPGGATRMNSTCIYDPVETPPYRFDPLNIPPCTVCVENVSIDNATSDWINTKEYSEGMEVTITCDEGFMIRNKNGSASKTFTFKCDALGWNIALKRIRCLPVCSSPPKPGSNMSINVTSLFIGTNLTYVCDEGTYIPTTFPNTVNSTSVTCEMDRTWNNSLGLNETELYCAKICFDDPVTSPFVITTWDNVTRTVGTKINLLCPNGFHFPDLSIVISVTCEVGGLWTNLTEDDILCRRYTESPPAPPNGSVYHHPPRPYWEGIALNFTCSDGYISKDGKNTTSVTFNGTEWVPFDPDFICLQYCGEPVPAEDPVMMTFNGTTAVEGDMNFYICPLGFEGGLMSVSSTCKDGNWTLTDIPLCRMCADPVPPPENVVLITDGIFEYGAKVTYLCQGEYGNGAKELESTCVDGTWDVQEVDQCYLHCIMYSHKSGAQKRKEKQAREEAVSKCARTLFEVGVKKIDTIDTNVEEQNILPSSSESDPSTSQSLVQDAQQEAESDVINAEPKTLNNKEI